MNRVVRFVSVVTLLVTGFSVSQTLGQGETCPGFIAASDPPNVTVDARQPHEPGDTIAQGIDSITIFGDSAGASGACWSLCETGIIGQANNITGFTIINGSTYTVNLARPITPGAVTTLTYDPTGNHPSSVLLKSHPADINADSVMSFADVTSLIDYLHGSILLDRYSGDINHSGLITPRDILRTIDLANGADNYIPWIGSIAPSCYPCCSAPESTQLQNSPANKLTIPEENSPDTLFGSAAITPIVVDLIPTLPGPYSPGQQIEVGVFLSQNEFPHKYLRIIQLDFTASDPLIGLPSSVNWIATFLHESHIDDLRFSNTFTGFDLDLFNQFTLPGDGSPVLVAQFELVLPNSNGIFNLSILNPKETNLDFGGIIGWGFGLFGSEPLTEFRASNGELLGGVLAIQVGDITCPTNQPDASCDTGAAVAGSVSGSQAFPSCGLDDFATGASFKVIMLDGSEAGVGVWVDSGGIAHGTPATDAHTIVGRSDPFLDGDLADDGAVICGGGSKLYPNTASIAGDPCVLPAGFPENSDGGQEIHTEILSLDLVDSNGNTVKAGQPFFDAVEGTPQESFYQNSFGEVQGLENDFPADSFFNVFVEVHIPAINQKFYNKTPMVLRAEITQFPPDLNLPRSVYLHDPSFGATPLFNQDGLHVAYLLSAGHGSIDIVPPPPACEVETILFSPISFSVDNAGVGLFPTLTPNHVSDDDGLDVQQVTAYMSSGANPGSSADITNARIGRLIGDLVLPTPPAFASGDAINSFSYGRDGSLDASGTDTVGTLLFSVDRNSLGQSCTSLRQGSATSVPEQAADIYASAGGSFGAYSGSLLPTAEPFANTLLADQTVLGLRPTIQGTGQDDMTGLEVSTFASSDKFYGTFTGESFNCGSEDCNTNGIPDGCEPDCQPNGIVDECDIDPTDPDGDGFVSDDVNTDGIPDECEPCDASCTTPPRTLQGATIFIYDNFGFPKLIPFRLGNLQVFSQAGDLGLQADDVIDALVLSDVTPGGGAPTPNGIMDAGLDMVLFSLSRESPTLFGPDGQPGIALVDDDNQNGIDDVGETGLGDDLSAADVFRSDFSGVFSEFTSSDSLGLLLTDNVDALDIGPTLTITDCNCNDIQDLCDIGRGFSNDCNTNGIPDECERFSNDCNCNDTPDECDIDPTDPDDNGVVSTDCNSNSIPDECDADCDGDLIPNDCEITNCTAPDLSCKDCNTNGIPDGCDITDSTSLDCNTNGIPDSCDIANDPSLDCDTNGIPDECETGCNADCVCDNSIFCDGNETCVNGLCDSGTPPCMGGDACCELTQVCGGCDDIGCECIADLPCMFPFCLGDGQCFFDDLLCTGACCQIGGGCLDGITALDCALEPGMYLGHDSSCTADPDNDGCIGCDDFCPNDPNKCNPGICGCGVLDSDSDNDGVVDCLDCCPGTPIAQPIDGDGCQLIGACYAQDGSGCVDGIDEATCILLPGHAYLGKEAICDGPCVACPPGSEIPTCPLDCSSNGTCICGVCVCIPGWTEPDCSVFICEGNCSCSSNTECNNVSTCSSDFTVDNGGCLTLTTSLDEKLRICAQTGDLQADNTLIITELDTPQGSVDLLIGTAQGQGKGVTVGLFDFEPDDLQFASPINITLERDVSGQNDNQREKLDIYIQQIGSNKFESLNATCCETDFDPDVYRCTVELTHFSEYGFIAPTDTDNDGIFDEFDGIIDNCPNLENPEQLDCNNDGFGDACVPTVISPQAEPVIINKNRYITLVPGNAGQQMGIRVTLKSLYHPDPPYEGIEISDFTKFENQVRWVGPHDVYQEGGNPEPAFVGAQLQCEPYFTDWGTIDLLYVFGDSILPSSKYEVQMIQENCHATVEETSYSMPALTIVTARWGDVIEPFNPPSGSTQPNIDDVLALVGKWLGKLFPLTSMAQLQPNVPNPSTGVSIDDVLKSVNAWLSSPYPFDGPVSCP